MATNHPISSNGFGRYHGAVKAKDLPSQKLHKHGDARAGSGEEVSKHRTHERGGFDGNHKPVSRDARTHDNRAAASQHGHRQDKVDRHDRERSYIDVSFRSDGRCFKDAGHFSIGKLTNGPSGMHGCFHGGVQSFQFTQITVTHSSLFSGSHLNGKERLDAHKGFLDAARSYLKNPSEQAYKSLNDAMTKLLDPCFTPSTIGGAANVSIRTVNGATMVKFTMNVTPAPVKSLDEAREDLKNAYSSTRDGEKDISSLRSEAYTNYIRALSEKFKEDGKISHTNHTPTTPVIQTSVIYIAKTIQGHVSNFRELKKPDFGHRMHGRFSVKDHHGSWNDYRHNHRSYIDLMKQDSKKSHNGKHTESKHAVEAKHQQHGAEKAGRKHHGNARAAKSR